jgi:hypothetical protein
MELAASARHCRKEKEDEAAAEAPRDGVSSRSSTVLAAMAEAAKAAAEAKAETAAAEAAAHGSSHGNCFEPVNKSPDHLLLPQSGNNPTMQLQGTLRLGCNCLKKQGRKSVVILATSVIRIHEIEIKRAIEDSRKDLSVNCVHRESTGKSTFVKETALIQVVM